MDKSLAVLLFVLVLAISCEGQNGNRDNEMDSLLAMLSLMAANPNYQQAASQAGVQPSGVGSKAAFLQDLQLGEPGADAATFAAQTLPVNYSAFRLHKGHSSGTDGKKLPPKSSVPATKQVSPSSAPVAPTVNVQPSGPMWRPSGVPTRNWQSSGLIGGLLGGLVGR
ncbi:hypothetical protein HDE_09124 [Halotydeus destructor]|nr:hypothetical protein HDE_09124 [Halotydeus destructor]